ncbi:MAG: hypothetical protein H7Y05_06190 [Steroidobacteraceae bacterium]|nr:hypothetical protein [Deltaproteobacteria bacterium]
MRKTATVFSIAVLMGLLMSPGIVSTADAANLQARSATISPSTGYPHLVPGQQQSGPDGLPGPRLLPSA